MRGCSFLAFSIQRSTVFSFGSRRTSLRLIGFPHLFDEVLRIAELEFVDRLDAGGAQELRIFPADALDAHAVGGGRPVEDALVVDADLRGDLEPLLRRLGRAQQADGRANPLRLQDRGRVRPDAPNSVMGYAIDVCPSAQYRRGNHVRTQTNCVKAAARRNLARHARISSAGPSPTRKSRIMSDGLFTQPCGLRRRRRRTSDHLVHYPSPLPHSRRVLAIMYIRIRRDKKCRPIGATDAAQMR